MDTVSALFEQPHVVRAVASLLPDGDLPELGALAAAAWATQLQAGDLHEHYSASLHLLDDTGLAVLAASLDCDPDEQSLWHAWIDLDADDRADATVIAAARAAQATVAATGDVDLVLDQVLPFLSVDNMGLLAQGANLLFLRAHTLSLN
jgi:hypothetical protein